MVMKLFMVGPSPYARKVLAAAVERGLGGRIERIYANPHDQPASLVALNPLSKVPTLLAEDGRVLFDSTVICFYLDSLGDAPPLLPAAGDDRWDVLQRHALAHGLMDASVIRRVEGWRREEPDRLTAIAYQKKVSGRVLDRFETDIDGFGERVGLDTLTLACAVGYLDFRYPEDNWRDGRRRLARWYDAFAARPALQDTLPHD